MLFAGLGLIRIEKNSKRSLDARGHNLILYGPPSRQMTKIYSSMFVILLLKHWSLIHAVYLFCD